MEKITPYSVGFVNGYRRAMRDLVEMIGNPKDYKKKEYCDFYNVLKDKVVNDTKFQEDLMRGKRFWSVSYGHDKKGKKVIKDIKLYYSEGDYKTQKRDNRIYQNAFNAFAELMKMGVAFENITEEE